MALVGHAFGHGCQILWRNLLKSSLSSDEIELPSGGVHQILVQAVDAQNQVMPEVNFSFYSSAPQLLKVDKMGFNYLTRTRSRECNRHW